MATLLYRLGRASVRRRGAVVAVWLVLLAALGAAALAFRAPTNSAITIPGTEAQQALDDLAEQFPEASGATGTVVVVAPEGSQLTDPEFQQGVQATVAALNEVDGVLAAVDPFTAQAVTPDLRYGLIQVQFEGGSETLSEETLDAYLEVGEAAADTGLTVAPGGEVLSGEPEIGSTEAIGVAVALVVLVITFGSLVAAGMTMVNALIGVAAGMAGLFALSGTFDMTSTAPVLALMLGLAVGIDYSLFITSRYRQHLLGGISVEEAAGRAAGTAGSAVVFAGTTVVIALAGFAVVGIPFLTVMGLAAAATVTVAVLVALTLLPALLGFAGQRVLPRRHRSGGDPDAADHEGFGFRWARLVTRFRIPVVVAGVIGLGVVALPGADMRLALPDAGSAAEGSPARVAYDLVSEGFGPGFNGRLALVVSSEDAATTGASLEQVAATVTDVDGVVALAPPQLNADGTTAILSVIPEAGPSDPETEQVVHDVRDALAPVAEDAGVDVALTGITAIGVDVSEKLADALPVYLLVVVGLSIVLLVLVFRSVLVPVKAAVGFLGTVFATFGATVAVFQWGWLADLVALDTTGPLVSFLPLLLIGILFGLAMDYEVFLVSRMREDFVHGETAHEATISGMGHGARVVTAAAIIMISVFGGFVLVEDPIIKSMGFALAFGVAVDAFVVRMTIVPAVVSLLGRSAWWLPRWLDRVLPNVDIEGTSLREHLERTQGRVDGSSPSGAAHDTEGASTR
ncbi:MMPL family transporter [Thalassiella azotivora]